MHEAAQDFSEFLQRNEARDLFYEIREGFFDKFQNGPHFLDADEFIGKLAVEFGEVKD